MTSGRGCKSGALQQLVNQLLVQLLNLYLLCIVGRILLSYFPISPGSAMSGVSSFLFTVTEPVLRPLRQMIPPIGMLDLSPMVVIFGIYILQGILRP